MPGSAPGDFKKAGAAAGAASTLGSLLPQKVGRFGADGGGYGWRRQRRGVSMGGLKGLTMCKTNLEVNCSAICIGKTPGKPAINGGCSTQLD